MNESLTFLDHGIDAIFVCGRKTGAIYDVNQRACELLGYSLQEIQEIGLGGLVQTGLPGSGKESIPWDTKELVEWHVRGKNGFLFWLEVSFHCIRLNGQERVVLIGRDVTQRRLENSTERAKTERVNRKMAAFAEFNPNPIFEFSSAGDLRYFNKAAEELAQSVGAQSPSEILPPETREVVSECWMTKKSRLRLTTRLQDRTISWSFFPIATLRRVHCYAGDITEKLALENQLRQSQKLEAIGQLASGVAHDFNNILTIIQGNASLFLTENGLSEEAVECAEQIVQAADRAAGLTRQLLVFSRKQILHRNNLNLNAVVGGMAKMLQPLLGEHILLRSELASNLPSIYADQGMIEQVLLNLAVNSRDAMPRGGKLDISTRVEKIGMTQASGSPNERPGLFVCLSVRDTGCGIPQEHFAHIFEPFFTTKEIGKGTGLGLATVYGIVHQHHGWIDVSSEPGKGTVFKIFIPAVEIADAETATLASPQTLPSGKETILVVEDEAPLRDVISVVLKRCGYEILMARSGVAALEIWEEKKNTVDLIFTDIVMPDGLNGQELVNKLVSEKPGLKVIYTSGYSSDVFMGRDFAKYDNRIFLQKPYHPHRLAQVVRTCLDGI